MPAAQTQRHRLHGDPELEHKDHARTKAARICKAFLRYEFLRSATDGGEEEYPWLH